MRKNIFAISLTLTMILLVWQFAETALSGQRLVAGQTSLEAFIPTPVTIFKTFISSWSIIMTELGFTLARAGLGLIIGLAFAILMSILFIFLPTLRSIAFPLSFAVNSFPLVGFAPVVVLIFGQGSALSIIFISALVCYFPTLISLDSAFRETDSNLVEFLQTLNASRLQILKKAQWPLAAPYLLLSLKLAIPASIIGATIGEWFGSRHGIGQLVTIALYQLKPGLLYASLLAITLSSLIAIFILTKFEHLLFPLRQKQKNV